MLLYLIQEYCQKYRYLKLFFFQFIKKIEYIYFFLLINLYYFFFLYYIYIIYIYIYIYIYIIQISTFILKLFYVTFSLNFNLINQLFYSILI
jgi:hypothetical protein